MSGMERSRVLLLAQVRVYVCAYVYVRAHVHTRARVLYRDSLSAYSFLANLLMSYSTTSLFEITTLKYPSLSVRLSVYCFAPEALLFFAFFDPARIIISANGYKTTLCGGLLLLASARARAPSKQE